VLVGISVPEIAIDAFLVEQLIYVLAIEIASPFAIWMEMFLCENGF
jgi:hypothetical protein